MPVAGYIRRFPVSGAPTPKVVAMRAKEWEILEDQIPAASNARLRTSMDLYCTLGPSGFPDTLFRFLEHYERNGIKVRLEEFKARAVRLFGFCADDGGTSTFFVTGADTDKKSRKADPVKVDLGGREAVRVQTALRRQASRSKGK